MRFNGNEATQRVESGNLLEVIDLGTYPYEKTRALQKKIQQAVIDGECTNVVIVCEHESVITAGRRCNQENLLITPEELQERGTKYLEVERGGDVTWHGPGQVVVYPIINLAKLKKDVHWYIRSLEEVIISALNKFGLSCQSIPEKTGVWTKDPTPRKIASIGVRISRWCTLHGFAINICNSLEGFSYINPCGMTDVQMTSLTDELEAIDQGWTSTNEELICSVKLALIKYFLETFNFERI